MGNCFRRDSSMVWAGGDDDDWETLTTTPIHHQHLRIPEKEGLLAEQDHNYYSSSIREIKIKISKKELEELVGSADKQQFPREQVLSRLINASQHCEEVLRQRSWRPRLQSIPEVN